MEKILSSFTEYHIGNDSGEGIGTLISERISPDKILVVTDSNVCGLYAEKLQVSLQKFGFEVYLYTLASGETSKNIESYLSVINYLSEKLFTRSSLIIALGGGVISDLAGFVAATYMRGIPYVIFPTTILAAIDSSIGGKTGIDTPYGKNLIGVFYQPLFTLVDLSFFKTLPEKELSNGLGEMVKYAVLEGNEILSLMLQKKAFDVETILLCASYKTKIVEKDERDCKERRFLNLGHTFAHSIEKLSNYTISHGEAVAIGVYQMIKAGLKHGLKPDEAETIEKVYDIYGLQKESPYPIEMLLTEVVHDKKAFGESITLVTVPKLGACRQVQMKLSKLGDYFGL